MVSQLGPTASVTKIRKYTLDLYKKLEKVDHSAGLKLNGALSIAENEGRWQELGGRQQQHNYMMWMLKF